MSCFHGHVRPCDVVCSFLLCHLNIEHHSQLSYPIECYVCLSMFILRSIFPLFCLSSLKLSPICTTFSLNNTVSLANNIFDWYITSILTHLNSLSNRLTTASTSAENNFNDRLLLWRTLYSVSVLFSVSNCLLCVYFRQICKYPIPLHCFSNVSL